MPALVYRVTKHTIPGWIPFHEEEPRGIAYETDTHFVHIFGKDRGLWVISPGLTATQAKANAPPNAATLRQWIEHTFGAIDIEETICEVGHTIRGVWRPGLFYSEEILQGLSTTAGELRLSEQSLLLLVQRLDELLHFIEPTANTLQTHGHKARELLILACTEVENAWQAFLRIASANAPAGGFNTNQYVRLLAPLHLAEYQVSLPRYADVPAIRPFHGWAVAQPTASLSWYAAYNKTKHDRSSHFTEATLWNCIQAVAANLVLFSVRFGPFRFYHGGGTLAAFFNQLFEIELNGPAPTSFYAPKVALPADLVPDLICFGAEKLIEPRVVDPLAL